MANIHRDRLVANIKSLWTSHMYSDLVVRCGEAEYKVHRAILCPRSAFFAKACNGNFMEGKTGIITMDDDDPEAVKRLLLYLYTFDYPDEDDSDVPVTTGRSYTPPLPSAGSSAGTMSDSYIPPLPSATTLEESDSDTMSDSSDGAAPHDPRLMTNVLVYAAAEKYDIPELKDLAKHKFGTLARSKWPQDEFHAVTEAVFSTTPDTDMGLRRIVMDICLEHFEDILRDKDSRVIFFENKSIAAVVLDAALRNIDHNEMLLDEAFAEQATLGKELSKVNGEKRVALEQKSAWTSRLDKVLQRVNKEQYCWHCGKEARWLLERVEHQSVLDIQLKCSKCRKKPIYGDIF